MIAPAEEQNKNPVERIWQTIQNDASGLLISQRNLCSSHWFLAVCTACTLRSCLVNESSKTVDPTLAPWTLLTGWKIDYAHLTSSFFGALATVPRVGKAQNLSTRNELCVTICPLFNGSYAHVVLLHGHRNPSIRGGVQFIQEEVVRLKDSELKMLEPEYDEDNLIKEFKSPALVDFSLDDKVSIPSPAEIFAPVDVVAEKGAGHWIRAVKSGSERSESAVKSVDSSGGDVGEVISVAGDGLEDVERNVIINNFGGDDSSGGGVGGGGVGGGVGGGEGSDVGIEVSSNSGNSSGGDRSGNRYFTRASAARKVDADPRTVLHTDALEMCWDSDERRLEVAFLLEYDEILTMMS